MGKPLRDRVARVLAVTIALCLVACGQQSERPPGVLIIGQSAEPKSLDPHVATSLNDFRILENVYEGLVRFRPGTLEIGTALASGWEILDDGRRYRFALRPGVRFHDGSPFNADAVVYNFERMLDESHPEHRTGPFPLAFFFSAVERVEAIDELTVEFHLKEPFAPFLSNLAYPTGYLVSPTAVRTCRDGYGRAPVGTGPFRFVRWESHRLVELERNLEYWDKPARLERVYFRPLTDENARLTELLAGGCDLIVEVAPDMIQYFREHPEFQVIERAGPHLWFLILNTREGPFTDPRVRQAANYAIDKQQIVDDLLQGTATVAAGPVPRAFGWAADPQLEPYPYDPERARALIETAGQTGATVTLYATESGSGMLDPKGMAAVIQGNLETVGLNVRIETYEWNTYLAKVNAGLAGQADMAQMAWMTNDPDTLPFLALRSEAWPEQGGFNSGYYSNPEVDRLLEAARQTGDRNERARLYRQMQRIVHDEAPWVFVASWRQNAVAAQRVRGLELEPSFLFRLREVEAGEANQ